MERNCPAWHWPKTPGNAVLRQKAGAKLGRNFSWQYVLGLNAIEGVFRVKTRIFVAAAFAALMALPAAVQAQGIVRGAQEGAATGNRAAGPIGGAVGGVVGGAVGGAVGGVKGVLGVPQRTGVRRSYRARHYRHVRRHR